MSNFIQYNNSPILSSMIERLPEQYDTTKFVDLIYNDLFNIDTAVSYGLDCLAKIVGIKTGRNIQIQPVDQTQSPYVITLTDEQLRKMIMVKALTNISYSTIPTFDRILYILFNGRGHYYSVDLGGMEMSVILEFKAEDWELYVLQSNLMPRSSGVLINVSNPVILINQNVIVAINQTVIINPNSIVVN